MVDASVARLYRKLRAARSVTQRRYRNWLFGARRRAGRGGASGNFALSVWELGRNRHSLRVASLLPRPRHPVLSATRVPASGGWSAEHPDLVRHLRVVESS